MYTFYFFINIFILFFYNCIIFVLLGKDVRPRIIMKKGEVEGKEF